MANSISNYQSSFRKKRSTTDYLFALQQEVTSALENKESLISTFYHLEKAYDKAWRFKILQKLHLIGLREHLAHFIINFLEDRYFKVQ